EPRGPRRPLAGADDPRRPGPRPCLRAGRRGGRDRGRSRPRRARLARGTARRSLRTSVGGRPAGRRLAGPRTRNGGTMKTSARVVLALAVAAATTPALAATTPDPQRSPPLPLR